MMAIWRLENSEALTRTMKKDIRYAKRMGWNLAVLKLELKLRKHKPLLPRTTPLTLPLTSEYVGDGTPHQEGNS